MITKLLSASVCLLMFCFVSSSMGQTETTDGLAPENYYDFWIGEWDLEWKSADGSTERGRNVIKKILDGRVLLENFEALSGRFKGYKGKSFSVFSAGDSTWKQTWVDSNGGYLDFEGRIDGDKRIFQRKAFTPEGNQIMQRMVFYDIEENSLTWDWEVSTDNGQSWELRWRIFYSRSR